MNSGWIKLHRQILKWEWYDDANTFRLFMHLLLTANHQEGKWHGIDIKAGEVLTGRVKLSQALDLTEQQVRTSLNKLKSTNEITIKTTKKYSIISIVSWNSYQQDNQQSNQQVTNKQPSDNHKQEGKEFKKEKKKFDFEKIYKLFNPNCRKIPDKKSRAYTLTEKAIDKIGEDGLLDQIEKYLAHLKKETWRKKKGYEAWMNSDDCLNEDFEEGVQAVPLVLKPTIESNRYSGLRDFTAERHEEERRKLLTINKKGE